MHEILDFSSKLMELIYQLALYTHSLNGNKLIGSQLENPTIGILMIHLPKIRKNLLIIASCLIRRMRIPRIKRSWQHIYTSLSLGYFRTRSSSAGSDSES